MNLFLSALLFSLSFNLDNIVIGTAYGIKKIKIGPGANLTIALVTSVGTWGSMFLGKYLSGLLPHPIANALGAGFVILLGVYFVIQSLIKLKKKTHSKELALKNISDMVDYAETSDLNKNGKIELKEAFLVALGLTVNNIGTGIAASISDVNVCLTTVLTFIFSIFTVLAGDFAGRHAFSKLFGKYSPFLSGLLLVLLGIFEFFH